MTKYIYIIYIIQTLKPYNDGTPVPCRLKATQCLILYNHLSRSVHIITLPVVDAYPDGVCDVETGVGDSKFDKGSLL